jgi:hypothetical protein
MKFFRGSIGFKFVPVGHKPPSSPQALAADLRPEISVDDRSGRITKVEHPLLQKAKSLIES